MKEKISLAIIGLGGRGMGQMECFLEMPDVQVVVVCDVYPDRVCIAQDKCEEAQGFRPAGTLQYQEALKRGDVDAVVVMTSWETHIRISIDAMRAGKRVAMEVGCASSIDECWELVHASEETGIPCMLLENCCFNKEEMTLLNMIRQGVFGELVHCEGGYEHDLRDEVGEGDINRHYRQRHFMHRNCELYPTHELGPIAKYLNINRGNRMLSLVSMSSKAAGLNAWYRANRPGDKLCNQRVTQGDIITTMIRCANGETITLTHDCTLPRPYSRGGRVQGTKGIWMEDNRSIYIESNPTKPGNHTWESDAEMMQKYEPQLWRDYEEMGVRGGHGGMDYLELRAFVESVKNDALPPIDVYDAAAWMAVSVLSEQSVAMGSMPVPVPDFTNGRWLERTDKAEGPYSLDGAL